MRGGMYAPKLFFFRAKNHFDGGKTFRIEIVTFSNNFLYQFNSFLYSDINGMKTVLDVSFCYFEKFNHKIV